MGRRNDHSREEIRELAIQAALEIVQQDGVDALSARKIATAIGYTPGSLYLVFKNLDDLILHANFHNLKRLHNQVQQASQHVLDPKQRLLQLGLAYLQFALEQPHAWRMIFEHRFNHEMLLPDWYAAAVQDLFALLEQPLKAWLGEKNADADAIQTATQALWSGVHGICVLSLSGKLNVVHSAKPQLLLEHLMNTYLAGLRLG